MADRPPRRPAAPPAKEGAAPRKAAWALVNGVTAGRLLSELGGELERLAPAERARAARLAADALRAAGRADRMLKPHLSKRPPDAVRNALRLATLEIGEGAAAHGVVDAWVDLVGRHPHTSRYRGLVNAVLRKIAEAGPEAWSKLPVPNLPRWLRRPLAEAWGDRPVQQMERAHFAGAPLDLTARTDPAALAEATGGALLPTGSVRLAQAGQVTALPGFAEGAFWVQDAAAALPARLLGARPGERVLDLCAAPGGKTLQVAATGADVTALDISPDRLARVEENLARCGLAARTLAGDALAFDEGGWDAILLDAPCSATGTIRRHPDLPHAKDGAEFGRLIELQARLLDHALTLLRPGGRLVFCTCSLLPDEGEVQVEEALAARDDIAVLPLPDLPGLAPEWRTEEGGLRLRPDYWPERGGMDGFYMALLTKPA
ncbi:ribosomal RNA small subunit methyltransferase B, putative [Oceanicola granulosus HTCC2516]|uniref:Ribosomal RNA small subunit methyltransferase B, putative n=1 Tax=Oceanicola granulosus (strain ATCC BAA-861 / DSM 15982 / KCTC 12143 / HTCC2516) TaxID=314256 RepID=Q2CKF3_OCEGH|nr:RsmB/NOP family class I SAM-dependent RNA methyltransferase [Oceanicola granulosus]EAR52836.1 ribosomal RNA small subunit methyltransferase B, putative [Oceanicola granulosus HTCC2516]